MIWDEERFWHKEVSKSSSAVIKTPVDILLTGAALDKITEGTADIGNDLYHLVLRRRVLFNARVVVTETMPLASFFDKKDMTCPLSTRIAADELNVYYELVLDGSENASISVYGIERCKSINAPVLQRFRSVRAFSNLAINVENVVSIEDVEKGIGPAVCIGDKVSLRFISYLHDLRGIVHASNTKGKKAYSFIVGARRENIKGFSDGVIGMRKNGRRIIFVPPHLAGGPCKCNNLALQND
ncbi:hypothetical protein CVT24_003217 [Panaeolus cyanescens]|uniref:peptidylprolyl isomerase n=1 Tax=Panaeolus cyanescens TaxID=181874 RepID=A0A409WMT2_9AGAR|nr:hypothetical protein CVT24_003217 [Panaeolus cyanescens]